MAPKAYTVTGTITRTAHWSIAAETEEEAQKLVEEHGMAPDQGIWEETVDWAVTKVDEDG